LPETLLTPRRNEREITTNVLMPSRKVLITVVTC